MDSKLDKFWLLRYSVFRLWFPCFCEFCCHCSVTKSCPTLCDPMDYSTPGSPILHYLPEFAQIHVHFIGDCMDSQAVVWMTASKLQRENQSLCAPLLSTQLHTQGCLHRSQERSWHSKFHLEVSWTWHHSFCKHEIGQSNWISLPRFLLVIDNVNLPGVPIMKLQNWELT